MSRMPIALAIEQARTWIGGTLPIDLYGVLTALLAEIEQQRQQPAELEARHEVECPACGATIRARMADAPVARRVQVEVFGAQVELTFDSRLLTPVESVAAFLRDLADHTAYGALRNVAEQLDPIAPPPLEETATIALSPPWRPSSHCWAEQSGFTCTEPADHDGDHIARGVDTPVCHRWTRDSAAPETATTAAPAAETGD